MLLRVAELKWVEGFRAEGKKRFMKGSDFARAK